MTIEALNAQGKRRGWLSRLPGLGRWIPMLIILCLWEFGSGVFMDPTFVSKPSQIILRIIKDLQNGRLLIHMNVTYYQIFLGYVIGAFVGSLVGYFAGMSPAVARVVEPYAVILNSIPKVAIAPLMIIWFGIGTTSKVVMAVLMVLFVMFFTVFLGVRSLPTDYMYLARFMGARRSDVILRVVIPFIAPYLIAGLKQAIVMAMIGTLVAEFIASSKGLGYYIQLSSSSFDAAGVFAGVTVLMVLVLLVTAILNWFEERFLGWARVRR